MFLKHAGIDREVMQLLRPVSDADTALFLLLREGASQYALHRVSVGGNDSGGSGYRQLRIPNA